MLRDYVVAARELNPDRLIDNQQDWINRHTVYTHGNGFIAAPANQVNGVANDPNQNGGYPIFEASVVGANGSVVSPGKTLKAGWLYRGSPAQPARELTAEEIQSLKYSAEHYVRVKNKYLA